MSEVQYISMSDIIIPENGQRKEFNKKAIEELADSIKEVGLIQPIVVYKNGSSFNMVAGRRRALAHHVLGEDTIRAVIHDSLDEAMAAQIELYENIHRLDLTWQEKDAAVLRVKELLELKNPPEAKAITLENIAEVITKKDEVTYRDKSKVEKALRRQQYADDPVVSKAKSAKDADKIIERKLQEEKKARLAEEFKEIETPHTIIFGDCVEVLAGLPDNTFDGVVSDPIYGIDMHEQNAFQRVKMQEGKRHGYDDSYDNWKRIFEAVPKLLFDKCKEQAACYLFCDLSRFGELCDYMQSAGWDVWNRPLIWSKGNIGSLPRPNHGPRYTYECILFAIKGDKETTGVYHDVIHIPQTTGHVHGAGKPALLYADLIRRSFLPGDSVLDFCAGSFPILEAANLLGLRATGIELDEKWRPEAEHRKLSVVGEA